MTFQEYCDHFQRIIDTPASEQKAPYNEPDYLEYAKLNWSRMHRWLKNGEVSEDISAMIKKINTPQQWIIIAEPWCGDAAHSVPFIELIARKNNHITTSYELRDSKPFRIEKYLTHGSKSIPKLIIKNSDGEDKGTWGPRPKDCQVIYDELKKKNTPFEETKVTIQKWYNADKGKQIQEELLTVLANTLVHAESMGHVL